ncbi:hypothetical protein CC80DRAFT_404960, partial [Byssothecium circinans]
GLPHTEPPVLGNKGTLFTFASPLHRRVAYRRLFPGLEPDAIFENLSLRQLCINAIARFNPHAIQSRRHSKSDKNWGIPEATFQDELYFCLSLELHYIPILSEYCHSKAGRIDFYVSDRKWGIEVLQSGGTAEIANHTARFAPGGNYQQWGMNDYIILSFCSRDVLRTVTVEGKLPCDLSLSLHH